MGQVSKITPIAIKVCGMKHNTKEVAALGPKYLGFIFYDGSPRNFTAAPVTVPSTIKKVGVFVNASIDYIQTTLVAHHLDVIQLHGDETVTYISELKKAIPPQIGVWKVFSVRETFDFNQLKPFEPFVDAFLFDTKGKERGGNGVKFNWDTLKNYPSEIPFVLSGGIGLADISEVKKIRNSGLPIMALDINSKFETNPGTKDIGKIEKFMQQICQ